MASRCVLLYSVAGGLINLEYRHVGVCRIHCILSLCNTLSIRTIDYLKHVMVGSMHIVSHSPLAEHGLFMSILLTFYILYH